MKDNKKQYWKGVEQLTNQPEFVKYANKEFPRDLPFKSGRIEEESEGNSRRDFSEDDGFQCSCRLACCM
jgi:MoCo/4Fe-4S cofactor protein with predicted Tat translocation signal